MWDAAIAAAPATARRQAETGTLKGQHTGPGNRFTGRNRDTQDSTRGLNRRLPAQARGKDQGRRKVSRHRLSGIDQAADPGYATDPSGPRLFSTDRSDPPASNAQIGMPLFHDGSPARH